MGFLLASFMGGLCIGSVGFSKLKLDGYHPLRIYAALEAGIAVCGFLVLVGLPFLARIYIAGAAFGLPGHADAWISVRHLPAAADHSDGRVAAGDRPVD